MQSPSSQEYWCVGVITSAHGIKGDVKIRSFMQNSSDITQYSEFLNQQGEKLFDVSFKNKGVEDMFIASIKQSTDRNEAESIKGSRLYLPRSLFEEDIEEDEFFYQDLIGMKVVLKESGEPYGVVKSANNFGAGDILEIDVIGSKASKWFPFVKAIFPDIDNSNKTITIIVPEEIE